MRERMEERLRTLAAEFKAGQEVLGDLETRQANVRNTLVRISGAIQVLEELLNQHDTATFHPDLTEETTGAADAVA